MKKASLVCIVLLFSMLRSFPAEAFDLNTDWQTVSVHGFLSQGFIKSEGNNVYADTADGAWQFNEFGINFSTELTDRLRTGIQLLSRDLGDLGNHQVTIDWAYGDYRWRDWLGLRVGKLKMPFGLYNDTRDLDMLRTSVFLPAALYSELYRDTNTALFGVGGYGWLPLASWGTLGYEVQYGEIALDLEGGRAKDLRERVIPADWEPVETTVRPVVTMGLEWETPLPGLRVKGWAMDFDIQTEVRLLPDSELVAQGVPAGYQVHKNLNNNREYVASLEYVRDGLTLAAEYFRNDQHSEGYYYSAAYRLTEWVEIGTYYSLLYDRDDAPRLQDDPHTEDRTWQKALVLTTRFDLTSQWIFKLEGHWIRGAALTLAENNPDGFDDETFLFAVKTTLSF